MGRTKINQNDIASNWRKRGFSFGVFTDPPGQVWCDFLHDTDELLMVDQGKLELEMLGKIIPCEVGNEILIPAKTLHTVRNVGKTTARWFYGYKQ